MFQARLTINKNPGSLGANSHMELMPMRDVSRLGGYISEGILTPAAASFMPMVIKLSRAEK
jgi:hypothetical protein